MHVVSGRNSVADPAGGFWDEVGGEEGRGLAPPPLQTCRIFFQCFSDTKLLAMIGSHTTTQL